MSTDIKIQVLPKVGTLDKEVWIVRVYHHERRIDVWDGEKWVETDAGVDVPSSFSVPYFATQELVDKLAHGYVGR